MSIVDYIADSLQENASQSGDFLNSLVDKINLPIVEFSGSIDKMTHDVKVPLTVKYGDFLTKCTLKWQGHSTLGYPKKNFTMKLDESHQFVKAWGSHKKYVLKASYTDPTLAKDLINAKMWGKIVHSRDDIEDKRTKLPNGGSIDGFPVIVKINSEFQGIYNLQIPKDDWLMGMDKDDANATDECIISAANGGGVINGLWQPCPTFSDDKDLSMEWIADEDNQQKFLDSINTFINKAVEIRHDGANFMTDLAPYMDMQSWIDYYIFNTITNNYDGYNHNYLLSTYDGVKWFVSVYDTDLSLFMIQDESLPNYMSFEYASHRNLVFELIYNYGKDLLKQRWDELRADILSDGNFCTNLDQTMFHVPEVGYLANNILWPNQTHSYQGYAQLADAYKLQSARLDAEINAM